ncbi:transcriptional regulator family: C2H2 zinc finger and Fungal Specific TF [Aspergillus niger]|nr:transcriptional regulator family: Fungal Specific TF and C2H2 zinc finger [Aspergillus niger]KAI3081869.1 transcriptional regulator family: C2H2 zinc finger and Fungal Specific TF [Aspergillus niger]
MLTHMLPSKFCTPISAPNFRPNLPHHQYSSIISIPFRMAPGRPKLHVPPCTFCGRIFSRSQHLRRHELIHTQEKPFQCHCGRAFSRQDLLRRHDRVSHSSTGLQSPPEKSSSNPTRSLSTGPAQFDSNNSTLPVSAGLENVVLAPNLSAPTAPFQSIITPPAWDGPSQTLPTFFQPTPASFPDMELGQDPIYDNFAFAFPNFVPSQLLDTEISLSDLLEQYPAQGQASQGPRLSSTPAGPPAPSLDDTADYPSDLPDSKDQPQHRLPSLDDQPHKSGLEAQLDAAGCPWAISAGAYKTIVDKLTAKRTALIDFSLPSRCALVRYLEGYFRGFHDHLPFLHVPTFRAETVEPELLLAMAAVGALHRFEHHKGHQLYVAARSLIDQNTQDRRRRLVGQLVGRSPGSAAYASPFSDSRRGSSNPASANETAEDTTGELQQAQALIVLTAMSSWGEEVLAQDSLAMSSQLAVLVRTLGIHETDNGADAELSWLAWVAHQQRRRTFLIAYIVFNLQSIIFNIPPQILTSEVAVCLPSCEAEWRASSPAAWERHRAVSRLHERGFTSTLNELLNGNDITGHSLISPFSNYILIHGLVQRIYFERQAAGGSLRTPLVESLETALKHWQSSWESTWESSLDPYCPKGPLGFNATALLRLAYIRLNCRTGLCHELLSSDSTRLKSLISPTPPLDHISRSPALNRAILQCIHALSIPVRVGIPYVARTQTLSWSVQHSICHLECAVLLIRWMQMLASAVAAHGMGSLREDERKLLRMAEYLIQETNAVEGKQGKEGESEAEKIQRLARMTAQVWAEISSGIHVFDLVRRIGEALRGIADMLGGEGEGGSETYYLSSSSSSVSR